MNWIGLDIGKRTIDVAMPIKGGKYKYGRINNDERGFEVFVERHLQSFDKATTAIVCETTGIYYFPILEYMSQRGWYFSAVNPMVIKNFARTIMQKNKTDKADAKMIARFGQTMQPTN